MTARCVNVMLSAEIPPPSSMIAQFLQKHGARTTAQPQPKNMRMTIDRQANRHSHAPFVCDCLNRRSRVYPQMIAVTGLFQIYLYVITIFFRDIDEQAWLSFHQGRLQFGHDIRPELIGIEARHGEMPPHTERRLDHHQG